MENISRIEEWANAQFAVRRKSTLDALKESFITNRMLIPEETPEEKEMDDKITEWHNSNSLLKLHEYLGMTREQYKTWLENG